MAVAPVALYFWAGGPAATAGLVVTVVAFVRHHQNIARLLAGTEPRIGAKKAAQT
jgi:glycerol-3-phosphate acyltransferase PlsY